MTETQTVDLRPWAEGDLWLVERFMGDPEMTQYLGGPETPEKLRNRHERYLRMNDFNDGRIYVIVVGSDHTPAGSIGYWEHDWQGQTVWETGWNILPEFQGQNLATLGTLAIIEKIRANGKHRYLHAFPSVENGASNAICRKAGFAFMGENEFEYPNDHFMLGNDWRFDLYPDQV